MNEPIFKFALRDDLKDNPEFLPTKAEPLATGWDVRCATVDRKPLYVNPGQFVKIPLGFRAMVPEGYWYELRPRSSSFVKKFMISHLGVIDEAFNHELVFAMKWDPEPDYYTNSLQLKIEFGEAIGQIIPVKRQEMIVKNISNEQLDKLYAVRNAIRNGGFGSSDGGNYKK